jgi:hypothetical protein
MCWIQYSDQLNPWTLQNDEPSDAYFTKRSTSSDPKRFSLCFGSKKQRLSSVENWKECNCWTSASLAQIQCTVVCGSVLSSSCNTKNRTNILLVDFTESFECPFATEDDGAFVEQDCFNAQRQDDIYKNELCQKSFRALLCKYTFLYPFAWRI